MVVGVAVSGLAIASAGANAAGPPTTGENDLNTGPRYAAVDANWATPQAATLTVARLHGRHAPKSAQLAASLDQASAIILDPAIYGRWDTLNLTLPLRAIHVALLPTEPHATFMLVQGSGNVASDALLGELKAYVWDPVANTLVPKALPSDAFCGSQTLDKDGNLNLFGGTTKYKTSTNPWFGSAKVLKYSLDAGSFSSLPDMRTPRWYPSAVTKGNGNVDVFSGLNGSGALSTTPESYNPVSGASTNLAGRTLPLYPGVLKTAGSPNSVLYSGSHYGNSKNTIAPKVFDDTTGVFTHVADPSSVLDVTHRNAAMTSWAGSADQQVAWVAGGGFPAVASSYFIDASTGTPIASAGPALPTPAGYVSAVTLPTTSTLETGGGTGIDTPVYQAAILDPTTRQLTTVAPNQVGRTYHSAALLYPDGRVFTFGGDPSGDANFELRVEVYSPPYLFQGTNPVITAGPTELTYGASYDFDATLSGSSPASAVLAAPMAVTHVDAPDQRVLKLAMTSTATGFRITLPTNRELARPGKYMLFLNDSLGRPSVAKMIHLT